MNVLYKNQRRWMRDQIDSGRKIYDIDHDPARLGTDRQFSPYCKIEHDVLISEGFSRTCDGTTVDVNGVPTLLHTWSPPKRWRPGHGAKDRKRKTKRPV